jgi:hypothetical protein
VTELSEEEMARAYEASMKAELPRKTREKLEALLAEARADNDRLHRKVSSTEAIAWENFDRYREACGTLREVESRIVRGGVEDWESGTFQEIAKIVGIERPDPQ